MTVVVKLVNSSLAKGLQHRLFKALLDELDAAYGDLLLHADGTRSTTNCQMMRRLLDLGFLTDLTAKLNTLNKQTPAPHDKRSECVQGQALCLDPTAKEPLTLRADTLSQPRGIVTGPRGQGCVSP